VKRNNFTKKDIIKYLSEKTGFSELLSKSIINDLLKTLVEIIKTENLNLKNIGTFKLIDKKERIGRNPKTNEEFIISSRKSISFSSSKKIVNLLNQVK
jgi:integration host factor subunit alpha